MRWTPGGLSKNIEDRRGSSGGGVVGQRDGASKLDPATGQFMTQVLGSTEQVWGQLFTQAGSQYRPTTLVAYSNYDQSGCGAAQAAMGPFYCPSDQRIYIDPAFFEELSRRFGAPGDFAQAYVIAHEVGHHIQNLEGTLDRAQASQARLGQAEGNQVQVGVELQADCYAGVWAARSGALEQGDIEEGMRAAEAIGDDTLQKQTQGRVVPESFTHGSSAQRMEALRRGLSAGNPSSCNYAR
jgi:predicted metalloprotease